MTGYGQAVTTINGFLLQVQARSVNHRYFDTVIRMPLEWQRHERVVKEVFQRLFSRGRIEITVTMELDQHSAASMEMNWSIAENYITVSHQLKERYQLSGMLSLYE